MQAVESSNSRIKQSVPQVRFFLCFKLHENQSISVYGFLEHFGTYQLNHSLTVILQKEQLGLVLDFVSPCHSEVNGMIRERAREIDYYGCFVEVS